jgi:RNA polymerase sigma-70 factor (ECF subfamily)
VLDMGTTEIGEETRQRRWMLVEAQRERLLRLATSRLGRSADVEDCVQEALIRAATFDYLDESRVSALLTTIMLRLCVDHQRRVARQQRLAVRFLALDDDSPENRLCEQAAGGWLLSETASLGQRERQVMLARAQGMTTMEAARALRISRKSAESAFTRARGRLRAQYHEEMAR